MRIAAFVAEDHAITFPLVNKERIGVGKRFSINDLAIEPHRSNVRRRMEEHCADMTPEERERFRQHRARALGLRPTKGESKEQ